VNERLTSGASPNLEPILRWPTERAKHWVEKLLVSAKSDDNIFAVIAIGSAVRAAVESLDLALVVVAKDTGQLQCRPPLEIDLRVYPSSEVSSLIRDGNDLLSWSLMFGKVLFQRNGYWKELLSSWKGRIPLPSYDQAMTRARKALMRAQEMIRSGDQDAASEMALSYLTHLARAELLRTKEYPKSRPELSGQLRAIGATRLAECLDRALRKRPMSQEDLAHVLEATDLAKSS